MLSYNYFGDLLIIISFYCYYGFLWGYYFFKGSWRPKAVWAFAYYFTNSGEFSSVSSTINSTKILSKISVYLFYLFFLFSCYVSQSHLKVFLLFSIIIFSILIGSKLNPANLSISTIPSSCFSSKFYFLFSIWIFELILPY